MQVILLERVAKLGQMGDIVDVKPGYARNFLLPQGKAQTASDANVKAFEAQKAQLEARNLETKKEAEDLAAKLDGQQFIVIALPLTPARFTALSHHVMPPKQQQKQVSALTVNKLP